MRIEKLLSYINDNLDLPLALEELSKQSCWSRWQLQRVFQAKTGLKVAQYVRELKLSLAAERLLSSQERIVDIAFAFGFNSEISFSRAFKQFFLLSPTAYRKQGLRQGIKIPLVRRNDTPCFQPDSSYFQIRIEHSAAFRLCGIYTPIKGLFAKTPNFMQKVPALWQQLNELSRDQHKLSPHYGVIDASQRSDADEDLNYWAGVSASQLSRGEQTKLLHLDIPEHDYAVLPVHGFITKLADLLEWFILYWLPSSDYRGIEGYEIEVYDHRYQEGSGSSYMEYWFPVVKAKS